MKTCTENRAVTVNIRSWTPDDLNGTWRVLRHCCFNLLLPAYGLYIRKTGFQRVILGVAVLVYAWTRSLLYFLLTLVASCAAVFILEVMSLIIYLYCPTRFSLTDLHSVTNMQQAYFAVNSAGFWVAEVQHAGGIKEIVGTIAIAPKAQSQTLKNSTVRLRRMGVLKQYRGAGIAKRLVETTIEFCKRRNIQKLELFTTEVHKAARTLYTKLGFRLVQKSGGNTAKGLLESISLASFEYEYTVPTKF